MFRLWEKASFVEERKGLNNDAHTFMTDLNPESSAGGNAPLGSDAAGEKQLAGAIGDERSLGEGPCASLANRLTPSSPRWSPATPAYALRPRTRAARAVRFQALTALLGSPDGFLLDSPRQRRHTAALSRTTKRLPLQPIPPWAECRQNGEIHVEAPAPVGPLKTASSSNKQFAVEMTLASSF